MGVLAVNPNSVGHPDPRFHGVQTTHPAKLVSNTKSDMALLDLYSKGAFKFEDTGKVCAECVNYYPDPNLGKGNGRCRARGFMRVSEDTPADHRKSWTKDGVTFKDFPECPLFTERSRLSRR